MHQSRTKERSPAAESSRSNLQPETKACFPLRRFASSTDATNDEIFPVPHAAALRRQVTAARM
jgi:hypothetical protein